MCDYFGITPSEFFDENETEIIKQKELKNETANLSNDDMNLLIQISKRLSAK